MATDINVALLARVTAKPGKESDVEEFLRQGQVIVTDELATITWFAVRFDQSTFGIFDAFPNDAGRQAHLSGVLGTALLERAEELFTQPPTIENLDVLATKMPSR